MAAATRGTGARPTPHGKIRLAENEIWDFVNGIILAENYIMYIYGFLYKLHEFMGFMCCSYLYIYVHGCVWDVRYFGEYSCIYY